MKRRDTLKAGAALAVMGAPIANAAMKPEPVDESFDWKPLGSVDEMKKAQDRSYKIMQQEIRKAIDKYQVATGTYVVGLRSQNNKDEQWDANVENIELVWNGKSSGIALKAESWVEKEIGVSIACFGPPLESLG